MFPSFRHGRPSCGRYRPYLLWHRSHHNLRHQGNRKRRHHNILSPVLPGYLDNQTIQFHRQLPAGQDIPALRSGHFARIYPFGERSRMDIVAYGGVLYREVILPLPFEDSLRSPLSRIMRLTSDVVDWNLFSPDPALHAETRSLADSIRRWLPGLRYGEDGALDADGRPVYIASLLPQGPAPGLNCSGFVKWIADGILHPLTGSWLSVAAIKERMTDWRGTSFTEKFEETHDPFFGLDWSRALAKEAWQVMYPGRSEDSPLAHDVSDPPFALIVNDSNPVNGGSSYRSFTDNFDDAGIEVAGLKATLFMLASREPGRFYLAQFNARDPEPPGSGATFTSPHSFPTSTPMASSKWRSSKVPRRQAWSASCVPRPTSM
jgi:hypothetical protein